MLSKRMQKSVFIAPFMDKRQLGAMQADLQRLYARLPLAPEDSVLLIPLDKEAMAEIYILGNNRLLTAVRKKN